MKFAAIAVAAAIATSAVYADDASTSTLVSPREALDAIKAIDLPEGVTLDGGVEMLKKPVTSATEETKATTGDVHEEGLQEFWGRAWGGPGLGFGGCGPYRFGFSCGGVGGWAYPLSYWNAFGAGLYGGGCGLGIPLGGMYFC